MKSTVLMVAALAAGLAAPAGARAAAYPPPSTPKVAPAPKGPFHTLRVGRRARYQTLTAAVKAAKAGDTIRLAHGTYREGVVVKGASKRALKIVGDPKDPSKVLFDGARLSGAEAQNAIKVDGADGVTISGLTAQHYKANGVFLVNVAGYEVSHVHALLTGTYGVYAFNSEGGSMTDSIGAWNNDSGFYVGQTPPQTRPLRTIVRNVTSYGNVLGFSGTNMRYVTITGSKFFNNALGIVPNALHSEKYAPPEDNVIADNDVFWNNFDYFKGAPFRVRPPNADSPPYPPGVGILLFGSRTTQVTGNRVFGNYLGGIGLVQQFLLKEEPQSQTLVGNSVTGNQLGLNGTDPNGRDLIYDGDGSGNCFGPNPGAQDNLPADGSTMAPCPFAGANAFASDVQSQLVAFSLDSTHERYFVRRPHPPQAGIVPLETYSAYTGRKAPK